MNNVNVIYFVFCMLLVGAVSCVEKEDILRSSLLTSIENIDGETNWKLEYEDCKLVNIEFYSIVGAVLTPRIYTNPIGFNLSGSSMEFDYSGDELSLIKAVDSIQGSLRERIFTVEVVDGLVTQLIPTETLVDGVQQSGSQVGVSYFYDDDSRIDSIALTNGNSIAYFYNPNGDLNKANYRRLTSGSLTSEFYSYEDNTLNPFSALPFRYLLSYAAFWSPRSISIASFDLRLYQYQEENGLMIQAEETTYGDSMYISRYIYQDAECQ